MEKMGIILPEWKLCSLEMDEAGRRIGEFFHNQGYDIARINPFPEENPLIQRGKNKQEIADGIAKAIKTDKRILAVYGNGQFHHMTYGLARLAGRLSDEYCYIHIDQHSDYGRRYEDSNNVEHIFCGNFTGPLSTDTNVRGNGDNVIYVGCADSRVVCVQRSEIKGGIFSTLDEKLQKSAHDAYISIDLDIMHPSEVKTGWPLAWNTLMRDELFKLLEKIFSCKRVISADIVGYAGSEAGQDLTGRSLQLYKDLVDMFMRE